MRVIRVVPIASLLFCLGACAGPTQGQRPAPPPPVNRAMLAGAWAAFDKDQFVQKVEFENDDSMKTTFRYMPETVPGKFSWSDDRTLVAEYQLSDAIRKAYQTAAKKQRDEIRPVLERTKLGKEGAQRVVATQYADELTARQTLQIGFTGDLLVIRTEKGQQLSFKRVK
jgi:hypothetical protein